ncbi:MAG: hypothetical protein U5N55_10765 [Cypionkella sp.]|nr:hypothetical protein [Cypionkella sp.]
MKIKITEKGVYDNKGKAIEPGTVVEHKGDEIPAWLANKAVAMDTGRAGKSAVTNPADAGSDAVSGDNDTLVGGE